MLSKVKTVALAILVILPGMALSADVVFFCDPGVQSSVLPKVELSCQFYGLQLQIFPVSRETDQKTVSEFISQSRPEAIIVSARSFAQIPFYRIIEPQKRRDNSPIPILLLDVDPKLDEPLLRELSEGRISGGGSVRAGTTPGRLQLADLESVAGHLNKKAFAISLQYADFLSFDPGSGVRDIIRLAFDNSQSSNSVFAMNLRNGHAYFFLTRFQVTCPLYVQRPSIDEGRILEAIPILMFLRYACRERCWQSPGHFANLTIDDPWLREPYGDLHFTSLLAEMEKANFHTTLAFIPWNYDRSQPAVISIFREHPERFSICIHGNDHDRSEFVDPNSSRHREDDIVQALARMEAFTRLTGISYDPVMVFPHTIANDAETLALLKKHNFLATVNQDNIPLSLPRPRDLIYYLRNVTLDYANFPSVSRAGVNNQSESDIALELFLGNPILLYDHHGLFRKGVDQFSRLAEEINKLEPSIRWTTLGSISRHLYLTRIREDGNYDVLAFCRSIELENQSTSARTYFVHKPESFSFSIRRLAVDGLGVPYEKTSDGIDLILKIPPGDKRLIELEYDNDSPGRSVDIAKTSIRSKILRRLSDFRDIQLSSVPLGRAVIGLFYGSGAYRYARGSVVLLGLAILSIIVVLTWLLFRRRRRIRALRRDEKLSGHPGGLPGR
jgi:hypothetical protein